MTCWRSSSGCAASTPTCRVIITVSPVPLVATATDQHVLVATTYSKAVLRVAAGEVAAALPEVVYFPAYELVTGPQAPGEYYAEDKRDVTPEGVGAVMNALMANSMVHPPEGTPGRGAGAGRARSCRRGERAVPPHRRGRVRRGAGRPLTARLPLK